MGLKPTVDVSTLSSYLSSDEILNRSRLVLFVLDNKDGKPLRRVPVYGEAVLFRDRPSETDAARLSNNDVARLLKNADLEDAHDDVQEASFTRIASRFDISSESSDEPEDHQRLLRFSNLITQGLKEAGLLVKFPPPSGFQDKITGVIEQAARSAQLTRRSPYSILKTIPLGCLSTDHTGFVSFDLKAADLPKLQPLKPRFSREERMVSNISEEPASKAFKVALLVSHNILDKNRINVLHGANVTDDAIVSRVALVNPSGVQRLSLALPSMQQPSLVEWRLSPGSFAAVPQYLIGADGCESFTPANFATETFALRQIHRLVGSNELESLSAEYPSALVVEYNVTLTPIGHSLGQIAYSLPLAPGESVRLAVIDWRRSDSGSRSEDTKVDEAILHDQARDRDISETVQAALQEYQKGNSVMGGLSLGAGGAASSGSYGAAGGGAASIGGAYTSSSGSRDLSASTMQRIADAIHQASSSRRELTSSVVVQTNQKEKENVETRFFANNNRGHTMTVLYYEMLRHFHLKIEFSKYYEAVLVDRGHFSWISANSRSWAFTDVDLLLAKAYILKPALLDPALAPAFDALSRLAELTLKWKFEVAKVPLWDGDKKVVRLVTRWGTTNANENAWIECIIPTMEQNDIPVIWRSPTGQTAGNMNDYSLGNWFANDHTWFELKTADFSPMIKWKDLRSLRFVKKAQTTKVKATLTSISMVFEDGSFADVLQNHDTEFEWDLPGDANEVGLTPPPPPPQVSISSPKEQLAPADLNLVEQLEFHLWTERAYYDRVLDLSVLPYAYNAEFENESNGFALIDHASPTPLEILGSYVAFPRLPSKETTANLKILQKVYQQYINPEERLISLPARGLFAEAKLGHCNVAEEIDNDRFWKWEEHPLPNVAPEVSPVQVVVPQNLPPNVDPSQMPAPVINIQQPPAEPDPQGMSAALKAISTPDIFRNMSGIQQVQAMLHDLTEAAVSMANIASKTLANQQGATNTKSAQQMAHEENLAKIASDDKRAAASQVTPDQARDSITLANNQAKKGHITPEKRNEIVENQLKNLPGSQPPAPPAPTIDPLRPRWLSIALRSVTNTGVIGNYVANLYQPAVTAGNATTPVSTDPGIGAAVFYPDGTQNLGFKPVVDRPMLILSLEGDVKVPGDDGMVPMMIKADAFPFQIPQETWDKYDVITASFPLTTGKYEMTASSGKEMAQKLSLSGKLNGQMKAVVDSTGGVPLSPSKLLQWVAKHIAGFKLKEAEGEVGGEVGGEITPYDETKTWSSSKKMEVIYYTGGLEKPAVL